MRIHDLEIPYCIDGCGRPATTERFIGILNDSELVEVVDLCCVFCAGGEDPAFLNELTCDP